MFLKIVICGKIFSWMCREFLRVLQRRKKLNMTPPEELKDVVKKHTYSRAQNYASEKVYFQSFYDFCSLTIGIAVLLSGALPYFWNKMISSTQCEVIILLTISSSKSSNSLLEL